MNLLYTKVKFAQFFVYARAKTPAVYADYGIRFLRFYIFNGFADTAQNARNARNYFSQTHNCQIADIKDADKFGFFIFGF